MKRLAQYVFLAVCAVALGIGAYYLVRQRSGSAAASRPVATRQVVAPGWAGEGAERAAGAERERAVNRIAALPNEIILDVLSINLDQDEGDEQILTVRKTDRTDGRLSVVVADYVPSRRAWVRSWEGETLATKPTTFSVQAKELLGDHELELICTGMGDTNEQVLDAFRRARGGSILVYESVCSLTADSIEVDEVERPEGYQLGQTGGESWPIVTFSRDRESPNILDQVKVTHRWDARRKAYAPAETARIPGAQIERDMIAKVLTGAEGDFERFIQGIWYGSGAGPFDPGSRLIVFDRASSKITFYSASSQEVFDWMESNPTHYGLYASCQNESVQNLRRLMNIELTGADTISIRVFEDVHMKVDPEDRWDGAYRKMPAGGASPASRSAPTRVETPFKLDGPYRTADGLEIVFAGGRYTLRSGDRLERGAYNAYQLGAASVVDLSPVRESGLRSPRRTYRASYSEQSAGRALIRRLILSPARPAMDGLELLEEANISLEQRVGG